MVAVAQVPVYGNKQAYRCALEQYPLEQRKVLPDPLEDLECVLLPLTDRRADNEIESSESAEALYPSATAKVPNRVSPSNILKLQCCSTGKKNSGGKLPCQADKYLRVQEGVSNPKLIPAEQLDGRIEERSGSDLSRVFACCTIRSLLWQRVYCLDQAFGPRRETFIGYKACMPERSDHARIIESTNCQ
jgi:hypothetical protein